MELMYKPGDKVMIRPDLNCREIYCMRSGRHNGNYTYNVVDQMVDQAGKVFYDSWSSPRRIWIHSGRV